MGASIATTAEFEALVVDGNREDSTAGIAREYGVRPVGGNRTGQGDDHHPGAEAATGRWLAVDSLRDAV